MSTHQQLRYHIVFSTKNRQRWLTWKQPTHHAGHSFEDEYLDILKKHEVEYDPRYVWD